MKAVIQRAEKASVRLRATDERREIGRGLLVLLGIEKNDTAAVACHLAEKITGLRVFEDNAGKMNHALSDLPDGAMLIVSQFTLCADTRKGKRPSFSAAALPSAAEPLYEKFVETIRALGIATQTGEFGAEMLVEVANDGPATFIVEASADGTGESSPAADAAQDKV